MIDDPGPAPGLELEWLPGRYAIVRLAADADVPAWALAAAPLSSVTRTDRELSLIVPEAALPGAAAPAACRRGWVALRVRGTLDFSLVGVLARLTGALARSGVPACALSTHDTDVLLVQADDAARALDALRAVAAVPS